MTRFGLLIAAMSVGVVPAAAEMTLAQMTKANGLAEIIKKADPCGYSINDGALEEYYVDQGLAEPEVLAHLSGMVSMAQLEDAPTSADCTLARVTGRSIGILVE